MIQPHLSAFPNDSEAADSKVENVLNRRRLRRRYVMIPDTAFKVKIRTGKASKDTVIVCRPRFLFSLHRLRRLVAEQSVTMSRCWLTSG